MNLIRIVVTGVIAGAAAWATLPASAQTKKAPTKDIEPAAVAQRPADLDRSQIIGNRELPKVTYIVPWKKPAPAICEPAARQRARRGAGAGRSRRVPPPGALRRGDRVARGGAKRHRSTERRAGNDPK